MTRKRSRFDVKNVGKRDGDEVAQLYVRDLECSVVRPSRELRGFERISLKAGEKKTVTLTLPGDKLSFYDEKTHGFIVEPGTFELMVGSSSEDIRLKGKFDVSSKRTLIHLDSLWLIYSGRLNS